VVNVIKKQIKPRRCPINSFKTNVVASCKEQVNPYNVKNQKELFLIIWKSRPHICFQCGKKLGDEPLAHYFSHRKAKSIAPELKFDPENVDLLCLECHTEHDFGRGL